MKKTSILYIITILVLGLNACSGVVSTSPSQVSTGGSGSVATSQQTTDVTTVPIVAEYDSEDLNTSDSSAAMATITLECASASVEGSGVTVNGSIVTIVAAGTYRISGTLSDGQIVVDTQAAEAVTLILDNVNVTSSTSAPIYVANAEKVIITLADGSENIVTDGTAYTGLDESGEPNAAIFSHDDLTINGNGILTVNANYNNGIASKDDLKITGGTITVNAVNDGIKGKDSVSIKDGIITIRAGADGIQSTNIDEADKGYIVIEGGTLNITATLDGIQAATQLQITSGDIIIVSGGGSVNTSTSGGGIWGNPGMEGNPNKPAESAKGLKAAVDLTISGGTFNINAADDTIHSNGSITIDGGTFQLSSGDDGLHADASMIINGGDINLTQSYEALESALITINDGILHLIASDDGINAGGGADASSVNGRPGQNDFAAGNYFVYINGGYVYVDANGDGLDTNGSFEMTGGVVIVNGPTNNGNGPLDYMGTCNVYGGLLVVVGSSGMSQAPSVSSSQYSLLYNFTSALPAGTMIHIETTDGQEVLTFVPTKTYQSLVFSSPELQSGTNYVIYTGGSSTGTVSNGLYSGGTYTPGAQSSSFTVSSMVTALGAAGMGFPGGGGGRPTHP